MNKRKLSVGILVLSVLVLTFLSLQYSKSSDWFVEYPLPLKETHRLFDIGVVDANGDDRLDIYTSNHHFRQSLLLAGGAEPTNQQVEVLLSSALETCELYFQAFQFVIWSGMDAKSATDTVLFETVGEA